MINPKAADIGKSYNAQVSLVSSPAKINKVTRKINVEFLKNTHKLIKSLEKEAVNSDTASFL